MARSIWNGTITFGLIAVPIEQPALPEPEHTENSTDLLAALEASLAGSRS